MKPFGLLLVVADLLAILSQGLPLEVFKELNTSVSHIEVVL
jgi:hypothetical protein